MYTAALHHVMTNIIIIVLLFALRISARYIVAVFMNADQFLKAICTMVIMLSVRIAKRFAGSFVDVLVTKNNAQNVSLSKMAQEFISNEP